ncbi:MAG: hypothetical protein EA352_01220 [Gemmatimonadales bacterium]|nr:MAG: hypothetical protein EA352_01220 [Gemmatimonadales bacterium]
MQGAAVRPVALAGRIALALATLLAVAACSAPGPMEDGAPSPAGPLPAPVLHPAPDAEGAAWVDEQMAGLELREAVAQLVFPWIPGRYLAEDDPEFLELAGWVEEDGIGGVVISIGTPLAYADGLNALQRRADLPLLVTSDFEQGGPGMRIAHTYALPTLLPQGGGTSFPPTMAFGALDDTEITERFGEATAREARAVGVHVIFSPVVDVNSNPENPIINTRAFGAEPDRVSRLARAYIRGARRGGAMTVAKHFPGHGDTDVDSHLALPAVTADRARLDTLELVPFRATIEENVDGIMTAHVAVPGVLGEGAPPATLSREFMTELLRDEMGFRGVVWTDALRMGAITEEWGAGEAAVLALEAGADVLVIPASVPGAIDAVVEAVEEGRIQRERLEASVRRVLEAKARAGLHRERTVDVEAVRHVVGSAPHRALAGEVASRSLVLVRDRDGLMPPSPDELGSVLSVTWAAPDDLVSGRAFASTMDALLPGAVTHVRTGPDTSPERWAELVSEASGVDRVLVNAYIPVRAGAGTVAMPEPLRDFIRTVEVDVPLVLTSFGSPYLLSAVPEVGTYLVAWGEREVMQAAGARALVGARELGGRLPIPIPPLHDIGEGLDRPADPDMASRDELRGDDLDEAGLLRGDDPGDDDGEGGPRVLRPAGGALLPSTWMDQTVSPLEVQATRVGMDPAALARLDALVWGAIADSVSPGVALAVGRGDQVVRLRGYGRLDWVSTSAPVTPQTLWDVASLTKVVATTAGTMALVEDGILSLDDPVVRWVPEFGGDGSDSRRDRVTVRHLLAHTSGLPAYRQFFAEVASPEALREAALAVDLRADPGRETEYSDIGFKVLAWVVEAAAGEDLEGYLERRVLAPLGMTDTRFNPSPELGPRLAPTEVDRGLRGRHLLGEVHDPNAWVAGGVAGHAGLFSTAHDLAVFTAALATGGTAAPCRHAAGAGVPCVRGRTASVQVFEASTVEAFRTRAGQGSSRALGWDTPSGGRSSAGEYFSAASFGHTGFTGTSIWIDPELDVWVVLLTSRLNPSAENTRHVPFRRDVHDAVAHAVLDREVRPRNGDGP